MHSEVVGPVHVMHDGWQLLQVNPDLYLFVGHDPKVAMGGDTAYRTGVLSE